MQRLEELVNELEPELYPPEYIAEEVRKSNAAFDLASYGLGSEACSSSSSSSVQL
jgi:hypothetical protein